MQWRQVGAVNTLLCGLLGLVVFVPAAVWGQMSPQLEQVEEQLREKQRAAVMHRTQMESIKDSEQLVVEMRRHFQMTEELLALMLERRKLLAGQEVRSGTSERGVPGGYVGQHATAPQAGEAKQGGETPGDVGSTAKRGAPGGQLDRHAKRPKHSGVEKQPAIETTVARGTSEGPQRTPTKGAPGGQLGRHHKSPGKDMTQSEAKELEQALQWLTEHSAYMETMQDRSRMLKEMLRHHRMLDQTLELMQR